MIKNFSDRGKERIEPVTLGTIYNQCLDAPGFVIFAAILTDKVDDKGNNIVENKYIRERFSYDDVKKAMESFRQSFVNDVAEG